MNIKLISQCILGLGIFVSCNQPNAIKQGKTSVETLESKATTQQFSSECKLKNCAVKDTSEYIGNNSIKVGLSLDEYRSEGYIIKDSLGFIYNDSTQAVIITLVKRDERKIEFKSQTDAPVKRLFLLFNKKGNEFDNVITSYNLLPNLEYGGRSDIGYYHLTTKKDTFSFNSLILPPSSKGELNIKFVFAFNIIDKEWYLDHCNIQKYLEDELVLNQIVMRKDFGEILAKDFDIYEFNPFVFLRKGTIE
jgi:hypothetical protein